MYYQGVDFPGGPGICVGDPGRPLVTSRVAAAASAAISQPLSPQQRCFQGWPVGALGEGGCLPRARPGGCLTADILSSAVSSLAGYGTLPRSEKATSSPADTLPCLLTAPSLPPTCARAQENPGCFRSQNVGPRLGSISAGFIQPNTWALLFSGLFILSKPAGIFFPVSQSVKGCQVLSGWFFRCQSGLE